MIAGYSYVSNSKSTERKYLAYIRHRQCNLRQSTRHTNFQIRIEDPRNYSIESQHAQNQYALPSNSILQCTLTCLLAVVLSESTWVSAISDNWDGSLFTNCC